MFLDLFKLCSTTGLAINPDEHGTDYCLSLNPMFSSKRGKEHKDTTALQRHTELIRY
jgi:hypothetical protein